MNVLVVGGGGREHAICWKLAQSDKVDKIYCAPGNAGISAVAECVAIGAEDIDGICAFAKDNAIDLDRIKSAPSWKPANHSPRTSWQDMISRRRATKSSPIRMSCWTR